jgi:hypothetical protein
MTYLSDTAHDALLNVLRNNTENLYICSAEPSTFTEAATTYKLGTKATPTIGAPANGDSSGRKITVSAISDGTVNSAGTATHYALTDDSGSELLFAGALDSSLALATGSPWTLTSFDIENPDPA